MSIIGAIGISSAGLLFRGLRMATSETAARALRNPHHAPPAHF